MVDVWHKLEEGIFDKNGNKYEYIIEQNKKNMRVRITKSYPKVKSVTTRYDPNIEVDGDADCYVPSYFGYNPKHLKSIFMPLTMVFLTVYMILLFGFGIEFIPKISVGLPSTIGLGLSYLIKIGWIFLMVFMFLIPYLYHTMQKWKMYFKLKKEGLTYEEVNQ